MSPNAGPLPPGRATCTPGAPQGPTPGPAPASAAPPPPPGPDRHTDPGSAAATARPGRGSTGRALQGPPRPAPLRVQRRGRRPGSAARRGQPPREGRRAGAWRDGEAALARPGWCGPSRAGPAPPPIVLVPCDRGRLQSIPPRPPGAVICAESRRGAARCRRCRGEPGDRRRRRRSSNSSSARLSPWGRRAPAPWWSGRPPSPCRPATSSTGAACAKSARPPPPRR